MSDQISKIPANRPWKAGYSRAIRSGNTIEVSGTVSSDADGKPLFRGDMKAQVAHCLKIIGDALNQLGSSYADVTRTRMFLTDVSLWREASEAHHDVFDKILPASSIIGVSELLHPDFLVEVEATAQVGDASDGPSPEVQGLDLDHVGFTVSSLSGAIGFWESFLDAVPGVHRIYDADYISDVTGFSGAKLDIAIFILPGDKPLELIEYLSEERGDLADRATPGTAHIAFRTNTMDAHLEKAISAGAVPVSGGPVFITSGPNAGGRMCYLDLPGNLTLELFEPPGDR